ncbi:MAG: ABC transporter permease [Armatimonadota bacterium]
MIAYILRRLAYSVLVLLGVSAITFFAVFASGDPVAMMVGADAGPRQVEEFRVIMGLDRPVYVQYLHFLARAARGDFGRSLRHDLPAMVLVLERLPATIQLAFAALAVSAMIALPLGVVAATRRGTVFDDAVIATSALGLAAPTFFFGSMLILLFAVKYPLLPPSGGGSLDRLILPVATLAFGRIAVLARFTRSGIIDVLSRQYIRTARAKGLAARRVLYRHALRNTLIPIVTLIGLEMGSLLGGAVITENVFAWPGVGRLIVQAVENRDFPIVVAGVLVSAAIFTLINLVVDIVYSLINPTVRYQ